MCCVSSHMPVYTYSLCRAMLCIQTWYMLRQLCHAVLEVGRYAIPERPWMGINHTGISVRRNSPVWGRGTLPFSPCPFTSSSFVLFFTFPFTYFLLLSISSLSTRIVPLRFQAGGRRKRPNLGLVCFVCGICFP